MQDDTHSASDHLPVVMDFTVASLSDSDGDGLNDALENGIGTNPFGADTDGDGLTDGFEVLTAGTDPLLFDTNNNDCPDGEDLDNFAPRVLPTSITTAWCLWQTYFFFLFSLEKCARNILPAELAKSFIPERQVRFTCGPSRTDAEHDQPRFGQVGSNLLDSHRHRLNAPLGQRSPSPALPHHGGPCRLGVINSMTPAESFIHDAQLYLFSFGVVSLGNNKARVCTIARQPETACVRPFGLGARRIPKRRVFPTIHPIWKHLAFGF